MLGPSLRIKKKIEPPPPLHTQYNDSCLFYRLGNVKKDKTSVLNQVYEFHESDMRHGVKKTVTVQLWGCEKWAMEYIPQPGDLVVNLLKRG